MPDSLDLLRQSLQRHARTLGQLRLALLHLAVLRDALGLIAVGDGKESVAGIGNRLEAQHFDRRRGTGFSQCASAVVEHGANLAERVADNVALVQAQRSILHQNRGHGAASAVELGFNDGADGLAARRGLGRANVGDKADHFQQQVEVDALLGADLDKHCAFAACRPLFGNQAAIGKLLLHAIGISFGLVDLVHGHDDRNVGGFRVIDSFERLRHHAVVRRYHDHHDVGDLGAARSHARKRFVARRIEEHNFASRRG